MAPPATSSQRTAIGILLASTVLAYANSLYGTFQFDDFATILKDPHLESPSVFLSHLDHMIRPVVKLTFVIDRRLYGEQPGAYHVLNLALHLGSGLLLYTMLSAFADRTVPGSPTHDGRPALAFWTALLFLIHPIGTETVTYISGRATGLMAFFYLAAFYFFVRSTEPQPRPTGFLPRYLASLLCFVLSLFSKESAVTFPGALLLWEGLLRRRKGPRVHHVFARFHLPFWGVLFLFLWLALAHPGYSFLLGYSLKLRPIQDNLLTQLNAVTYAVSLFFLPNRLNFDHDLPLSHSILQWPTPLSAALVSAMIATAFLSVRKAPYLAFGLLWFYLHLTPTNSALPRYDLLSERNLYLPAIGLFLAIVSASLALMRAITVSLEGGSTQRVRMSTLGRRAIRCLPPLIALFLGLSTMDRNAVYADPVTFWSDVVRKSPHKPRPRNNLGYAYFLAGDLDRAMEEFRIALSLDRNYYPAQQNLLKAWTLKSTQMEQTRD